jgi:hypothetical protein
MEHPAATACAAAVALATFGAAFALDGCTVATQQRVVVDGQLFCARATPAGPLIVAIADAAGVPVVVTGMASSAVAAICAVIAAIPVTPPANPAQAPVVAVALPAAVKPAT